MKRFISILLLFVVCASLLVLPSYAKSLGIYSPKSPQDVHYTGTASILGDFIVTYKRYNAQNPDFYPLQTFNRVSRIDVEIANVNGSYVIPYFSYIDVYYSGGTSFFGYDFSRGDTFTIQVNRLDSCKLSTSPYSSIPFDSLFEMTSVFTDYPSIFGFISPFFESITWDSIFPVIFGSLLLPIFTFIIIRRLTRV